MKTRWVTDTSGRELELTKDEEKVIRTLYRLNKMDFGRLMIFAGNGMLSARLNGGFYEHEILTFGNIPCDGGDGGD